MSIKAFPLNQQEYSYNAQDVMKYYAGRNSGVFETGENLKVSANGGLEIRVNSGMGWLSRDYVASVAFWNESVEYLMVDAGHDTYDRVDLVVVSWNFVQQEQNPKLVVRKGTPASSPTVPALVNNSSTIEIALARINVGKGSIELHDADIVDLRGDDTYCPMVYDEQTIREAFRKCVGYADGVNKISDFPIVTPSSSDKILIEQGGAGKSATLESLPIPKSVQNKLDTKVNYTDSLTYEEIMATNPVPDLTNKVASASAVKSIGSVVGEIYTLEQTGNTDIPHAQHVTIYKGLLPKGVYILTAKLYINSSSCLIECQNLRTQNVPTIYYTLSGLIESNGTSEIKISLYQSSGNPISRPYNYDYVRLVRLR